MNVLFMDDDPERHAVLWETTTKAWQVHTAEEAIHNLAERPYDLVCLDHDLKEDHYDGLHDEACG